MTDKQAVNQRLMATLVVAILVGVSVLTVVSIQDDGMMPAKTEATGTYDETQQIDIVAAGEAALEEEQEAQFLLQRNPDGSYGERPADRPDWPTPTPGSAMCKADDPAVKPLIESGQARFTEDPSAARWRNWWVGPGDVQVPPPPALSSSETAEELKELHELQQQRDDFQRFKAAFVDSGFVTQIWEDKAYELVIEFSPNENKDVPRMAMMYGMLQTAMYDAMQISWFYKYCYLRPAPYMVDPLLNPIVEKRELPSYPSEHAAVAGAAYVILERFFPEKGPDDDGFTILQNSELAKESRLWGGGNYRSDVEVGYELGRQVAQRILEIRGDDDFDIEWDPNMRPEHTDTNCVWIEAADNPNPPVQPLWGHIHPILMRSGDQFRAPPPPECGGEEWVAQTLDLKETVDNHSARKHKVAEYWAAGAHTVLPPGMSLQIATNKSKQYGLSSIEHARIMSYVGAGVADSGIMCWDSKFAYWTERPITTIQYHYDPDWVPPLTSSAFPAYPSGHSCITGTGQSILQHFFPDDYHEFESYITATAMSRFYGGIHIRADNDVGADMGKDLARFFYERAANDGGGDVYYRS